MTAGTGFSPGAHPDAEIPNPDSFPELYEAILPRRVLAYLIDLVCIGVIAAGIGIVFALLWLLSFGLLGPLLWFLFGLVPLAYHFGAVDDEAVALGRLQEATKALFEPSTSSVGRFPPQRASIRTNSGWTLPMPWKETCVMDEKIVIGLLVTNPKRSEIRDRRFLITRPGLESRLGQL
jgi:hypothetical protein